MEQEGEVASPAKKDGRAVAAATSPFLDPVHINKYLI
jgi:hypothetical protein